MAVQSTRLRFASSTSAEVLEAFINALPFKVEIKSIVSRGTSWFCWFILPDNIDDKMLHNQRRAGNVTLSSINLEDF